MDRFGPNKRMERMQRLVTHGADVVRMYVDEGKTQSEIGKALGFSQSTIGQWLKVLGVRPRARESRCE
jgi:DNA-directed RNA polymerase specialized sigma subunit